SIADNSQFGAGVVVIEISPIEMLSEGQVRLARVRLEPKSCIYNRLCQCQASGRVIDFGVVERVVGPSQPAIRKKKGGIASDRLIKQVHRLQKILLTISVIGSLDQRHGADIKIVGNKVLGRPLLHG